MKISESLKWESKFVHCGILDHKKNKRRANWSTAIDSLKKGSKSEIMEIRIVDCWIFVHTIHHDSTYLVKTNDELMRISESLKTKLEDCWLWYFWPQERNGVQFDQKPRIHWKEGNKSKRLEIRVVDCRIFVHRLKHNSTYREKNQWWTDKYLWIAEDESWSLLVVVYSTTRRMNGVQIVHKLRIQWT